MATSTSRKKPRAGKTKAQKGVSSSMEALWRVGGPLAGYKNIPWAISKVEADGKTYRVKGYIRDDDRLEENMTLQLIAALGFPRPPSNDWKVDAYFPELSFFAELHETQHVDKDDFRMKDPARWAAQKLSDKRKLIHLLSQGFHGVIVLGFDGPFYNPGRPEPRWLKVGAAEVQRRTLQAMRAVAAARLRQYRAGDYAGRVMVFCSPMASNDTALACPSDGSSSNLVNCFDSLNIGGRYLELDEIHAAAAAVAGFSEQQKQRLLQQAEDFARYMSRYDAAPRPDVDALPAAATANTTTGNQDDDDSGEDTEVVPALTPPPAATTPMIGHNITARAGTGEIRRALWDLRRQDPRLVLFAKLYIAEAHKRRHRPAAHLPEVLSRWQGFRQAYLGDDAVTYPDSLGVRILVSLGFRPSRGSPDEQVSNTDRPSAEQIAKLHYVMQDEEARLLLPLA